MSCLEYLWIVNDILLKKPDKYTIKLYRSASDIIHLMKMYLRNKCQYTMDVSKIVTACEMETVVVIKMNWS